MNPRPHTLPMGSPRAVPLTLDEMPTGEPLRQSGVVPVLIRPGQRIGDRYIAVRPLGEGGMGSIWEVRHDTLETHFALKLLHEGAQANAETRARFVREAQTAARFHHPNAVRVVDHSNDPLLGPFLVMELLRGRCLGHALYDAGDRGLGLTGCLEWLAPVASALDAMHAEGFVHRDVKPANIMQVQGHGGSLVKLVDFGLASRADGSDRLTRKGMVVGTPDYVAPEVVTGQQATAASDIYSLAITAYEVMSGVVPFEGTTALAILSAKTMGAPRSVQTPGGGLYSLPIQLLFRSALSPNPAKRPKTAGALVAALAGSRVR